MPRYRPPMLPPTRRVTGMRPSAASSTRVNPSKLLSAKPAAVHPEDPRTVRMVYFLPNDRPFRADVVDSMKAVILRTQAFFAAEMQRHGHGNRTIRFETDDIQ